MCVCVAWREGGGGNELYSSSALPLRCRQGNNKGGVGRRGEENDENMRLDPFAVLLGELSLYLCLAPRTEVGNQILSVCVYILRSVPLSVEGMMELAQKRGGASWERFCFPSTWSSTFPSHSLSVTGRDILTILLFLNFSPLFFSPFFLPFFSPFCFVSRWKL